MRLLLTMLLLVTVGNSLQAQWELQNSHVRADLRGIYNVGGGVAWASGSKGTVLRTEDGGKVWQSCTTPEDAARLDFRGIQALDEQTAIVMSSGAGKLSRIYKTIDRCRTWQLLFTNPGKDGFWDDILYDAELHQTLVLGDPVGGRFVLYENEGNSHQWSRNDHGLTAFTGQTEFAASNSILVKSNGQFAFVTGGSRSEIIRSAGHKGSLPGWSRTALPFASGETSGPFSVATRKAKGGQAFVIVGGNFEKPNQREGTAAFSADQGSRFSAAETAPGGYRSAVAYDGQHRAWITVGPNGTDVSWDDGRNWSPLSATSEDTPDSGKNWNALSLPFVVGAHGRIGKLRPSVFASKRALRRQQQR